MNFNHPYKPILLLVFMLTFVSSQTFAQWQSELVKMDEEEQLTYIADADGFIIPDFSYAGYKYGETALPKYTVHTELSPVEGDNTNQIQNAIDELAKTTPNGKGERGSILLKAGTYEIYGTIYIHESGISLIGEGEADDPTSNTIIWARGDTPSQRTVIQLGNTDDYKWNSDPDNTKEFISNDTVALGSKIIQLEDASAFAVGDQIIIYHPCTYEWLEKVNYGDTGDDKPWTYGELPIQFYRTINEINGNEISLDAPLFYPLIKSIAKSYVFRPDANKMKSGIGIEHIRIEIESEGSEDESHAWDAIRFNLVQDAWAKNCTVVGFGQAGFVTQYTYRTSINNCTALDPVGKITGERMYNFNFYHGSQLILLNNCYARNARHSYISNGTSTVSGCVVNQCTSDASYSAIEGHRKWTCGLLFDNLKETNLRSSGRLTFALYNRGDKGTAHGWSAAHCVAWNCDFSDARACIQKPPGAQNYAIGCKAKRINGDEVDFPQTIGYVEGTNKENLEPASLYRAQFKQRTNFLPIGINTMKQQGNDWMIYPNPSENEFSIHSRNNQQIQKICVYNIIGELVLSHIPVDMETEVHIDSSLEVGIYLIKVITANDKHAQRLVIQ